MEFHRLRTHHAWRIAMPALAAAFALSGCVGSPTYGTGKPADQQLLEDITGVLAIGPQNKEQIDYKPRPEIVKPATTDNLPPPQDPLATASNPAWPETPEQTRQRLRAEATENRNNPNYRPRITDSRQPDTPSPAIDRGNYTLDTRVARADGERTPRTTPQITSAAVYDRSHSTVQETPDNAREEFNRRLAQQRQGSPGERRYLSEPPLDYRVPAATAPANDVGEDEWRKEKRQKSASRKKSGNKSWRDYIPWL